MKNEKEKTDTKKQAAKRAVAIQENETKIIEVNKIKWNTRLKKYMLTVTFNDTTNATNTKDNVLKDFKILNCMGVFTKYVESHNINVDEPPPSKQSKKKKSTKRRPTT
eukprot:2146088-Ditylum_brightwellii.AAC.1